jgi:DNA-directed RNA polymerase subunit RPC12/RpoP
MLLNSYMFIKKSTVKTEHVRTSKLGIEHKYVRSKTIVHFICDCCNREFVREKGDIDPKRLSNNYFHVCSECDSKRFAKQKQVDRKKIWDLTASSNLPIGKL